MPSEDGHGREGGFQNWKSISLPISITNRARSLDPRVVEVNKKPGDLNTIHDLRDSY